VPINLHQQLPAQSPIRVAFILRFLKEYGIVANFDPRAKGAKGLDWFWYLVILLAIDRP
jgi:hypothetical protein